MSKYTVLIDCGHGELDANNKYHCIKSGKYFKHTSRGFHNKGAFYEGRFNRIIGNQVAQELRKLGISYLFINDSIIDIPLEDRVTKVNHYDKALKGKCFVLSLHANASKTHTARGYEVFTSPGPTNSDTFATFHYNQVKRLLGNKIKFRDDFWSDNDADKEARFYILQRTKPSAILVEHLFFDQLDDALLLMDKDIQKSFAKASALASMEFINFLNNKDA